MILKKKLADLRSKRRVLIPPSLLGWRQVITLKELLDGYKRIGRQYRKHNCVIIAKPTWAGMIPGTAVRFPGGSQTTDVVVPIVVGFVQVPRPSTHGEIVWSSHVHGSQAAISSQAHLASAVLSRNGSTSLGIIIVCFIQSISLWSSLYYSR